MRRTSNGQALAFAGSRRDEVGSITERFLLRNFFVGASGSPMHEPYLEVHVVQ